MRRQDSNGTDSKQYTVCESPWYMVPLIVARNSWRMS